MPTKPERTALMFLGAVALAGGVVRFARAARQGMSPEPAAAAALAGQRRAIDSAASARAELRGVASPAPGRRSARTRKAPARDDSLRASAVSPPRSQQPPGAGLPIDIDRATAPELERLPRIGPALAERIVAERDKNGPFGSFDALDKRVKGVGPSMVKALQSFATFSGR